MSNGGLSIVQGAVLPRAMIVFALQLSLVTGSTPLAPPGGWDRYALTDSEADVRCQEEE